MIKRNTTVSNIVVGGNKATGNIPGTKLYLGDNRVFPIDGSINNTFQTGGGANNLILTVAISNNRVVIGGSFTAYAIGSDQRITVRNLDGNSNSTFSSGSGFNNTVGEISLQPDGKIIISGEFTNYNNNARNRMVRLNTDGSIDNTFSIGTGFDFSPRSTKIQTDGKLIVGGGFSNYNGTGRNGIIRLNTNGSLDNTFNIGTGVDGVVLSTVIQPDGKVIVGGFFTNYNGTGRNNLVRINTDGTVDTSFTIGTGFNSVINNLNLQADGKIIVTGGYTSYNSITRNRIVRLNTDGSFDNTFSIGTGFNGTVNSTLLQPNGKVIVGGSFTLYKGVASNFIIRLNSNGDIDKTFDIGTGFNNFVSCIGGLPDNEIIVGGDFTLFNGNIRNRIVSLYS